MKHKIPYPFGTQKIWRLCYHKTYYFYENLRTRIGGWKLSGSSISCAVIFDLARYLTAVKIINSCKMVPIVPFGGNFCFQFFFRTWSPSVKLSHRLEQAILVAPKTQSLLKWWLSYGGVCSVRYLFIIPGNQIWSLEGQRDASSTQRSMRGPHLFRYHQTLKKKLG